MDLYFQRLRDLRADRDMKPFDIAKIPWNTANSVF